VLLFAFGASGAVVGVGQNRDCDSRLTCTFRPSSRVPAFVTSASAFSRPPFGTCGVSHVELTSVRFGDPCRDSGAPGPRSQSAVVGVGQSPATICDLIASGIPAPFPFAYWPLSVSRRAKNDSGLSPSLMTAASGVGQLSTGHCPTAAITLNRLSPQLRSSLKLTETWPLSESPTFGVGHPHVFTSVPSTVAFSTAEEEEPLPLVRGTDFRRCKQTRRKSVTHFLQRSDGVSPEGTKNAACEGAGHVLEEDGSGFNVADDADSCGPQPSDVGVTLSLPGDAGGLAGDSPSDAIHAATPRSAIEGGKISEDRALIHVARLHRCFQERNGERFPLDHAHRSRMRNCQSESEVKSANAGTEGQNPEGT
jgi:hypothetical protein